MPQEVLYSIISLLVVINGALLRWGLKWAKDYLVSGFAEIKAMLAVQAGLIGKLEERQAKSEKDCVTWADLEKERLRVDKHEVRLAVVESNCSKQHGD